MTPTSTNAWTRASDEQRVAVETLAAAVHAQVALAPLPDAWRIIGTAANTTCGRCFRPEIPSLSRLWFARVKAQPGVAAKIRMGIKLVVPNRNRMAQRLGHRPTSGQMAHEYLRHAKTAAGELGRLVRSVMRRRLRQGGQQ